MVEGNKGKGGGRPEKEIKSIQTMDLHQLEELISRIAELERLRAIALAHNESSDYREYTDSIAELEKRRKRLEDRVNRT